MMPNVERTRLSIVVPVYFNEENLPDTVPRLLALRPALGGMELELVFVDDGSGDQSLELLLEARRRHGDAVTVVKLSRNFGAMAAVQAGLEAATGDCVAIIAADLQDPPELIADMVGHWRTGVKAVFAVRADREESVWQKFFSNNYYRLLNRFALPGYPSGGFDFVLIDRQLVGDLRRIREKNTNLMSLIFWLGYRPVMIPYVRQSRRKGRSRWTLMKKVKLFVDSFVAFSYAPIRTLSLVGAITALAAFAYAATVFTAWLLRGIPVRGYAPVVILIALASGVQMMMLGVLGEYLWRTLDEVRRRPPFVVDEYFPRRETPTPGPLASGLPGAAVERPAILPPVPETYGVGPN